MNEWQRLLATQIVKALSPVLERVLTDKTLIGGQQIVIHIAPDRNSARIQPPPHMIEIKAG